MHRADPQMPNGAVAPKVSVVIPTFNRERWIGEAIQSALEQETKFHFEVIVSDDGSTDNTVAVAKAFGSKICMLETTVNRGAAAARNAAIRVSNAPYIAFLDSDDVMLPGRLQTQIDFLETHPDVGLVNAAAEHEAGERADDYYRNRGIDIALGEWKIVRDPRRLLARTFFGAPSTTTVRKALLERIGLFDESIIAREDWEFFFRAAAITAFGCCNRPFAWMRTSHQGRYGPSPQGAIREPALLQHIIESTPNLTDEELTSLMGRYRGAVRNALGVSLASYGRQQTKAVFREHGAVLSPCLRLKWKVASQLPDSWAQSLLRLTR